MIHRRWPLTWEVAPSRFRAAHVIAAVSWLIYPSVACLKRQHEACTECRVQYGVLRDRGHCEAEGRCSPTSTAGMCVVRKTIRYLTWATCLTYCSMLGAPES